jgi:hypothetical protein
MSSPGDWSSAVFAPFLSERITLCVAGSSRLPAYAAAEGLGARLNGSSGTCPLVARPLTRCRHAAVDFSPAASAGARSITDARRAVRGRPAEVPDDSPALARRAQLESVDGCLLGHYST